MLSEQKDLQYIYEKNIRRAQKGQPASAAYIADCLFYGWGVDVNRDVIFRARLNAATFGDGRSAIIVFFILINNNEVNRAITFLEAFISVSVIPDSIEMKYIKRLLSIIKTNPALSSAGLFRSFSEKEDEYFLAMCYLYGLGCSVDFVKASDLLIRLINKQIANSGEQIAFFANYKTHILLLQCAILIDKEKYGDRSNGIHALAVKLSRFGDYSLITGDFGNEMDNYFCGYYELSLAYFSQLDVAKAKRELCKMYAIDLANNSELEYPHYDDIFDELSALNEKGENIKDVLCVMGLSCSRDIREKSVEQLIERGNLVDGYRLKAGLYEEDEDYENALKYLNLWADLNEYSFRSEDSFLSSATAQYFIGTYYFNGYGVKKDIDEAVKWWAKAAQNGNEDAKDEIDSIKRKGKGSFLAGVKVLKSQNP